MVLSLPPSLSKGPAVFPVTTRALLTVATFLLRLTSSWLPLLHASYTRGYPLLVSEQSIVLNCSSTILQSILFEISAEGIGIPGGLHGSEIERLFRKDQEGHVADGARPCWGMANHDRF